MLLTLLILFILISPLSSFAVPLLIHVIIFFPKFSIELFTLMIPIHLIPFFVNITFLLPILSSSQIFATASLLGPCLNSQAPTSFQTILQLANTCISLTTTSQRSYLQGGCLVLSPRKMLSVSCAAHSNPLPLSLPFNPRLQVNLTKFAYAAIFQSQQRTSLLSTHS